jgi:broad specificity phosphatase PhoE
MRHGAGIKPGDDPKDKPPSSDHVLTAEGLREAQAVGDRLAETLATAGPDGRPVKVAEIRYAGATGRLVLLDQANQEPEATARAVAHQLTLRGIEHEKPTPWPVIRPEVFPASSSKAADKACKAAECLKALAERHRGQAILVVGNSPQVDWLAEQLVGRPIAVGRGEVVCLATTSPRQSRWGLRWTVGPSEEATIKELRDKIRSKMDTAKFLGTFITALVSFVLAKWLDALKAAAANNQPIPIPPGQHWLWLLTVVLLLLAAVLCFAALFFYDGLLMPDRYWTSSARRRNSRQARWVVQRPPSSAAWILQQNMMRLWNRLVVPAIVALGAALVVFTSLVLVSPGSGGHLTRPQPIVVGTAVAHATIQEHRR